MPKYDRYQSSSIPREDKRKTHPVWRGIGCVLIVIIPLLSYMAGNYLVNNADSITWMSIPKDIVYENLKDPFIVVKIAFSIVVAAILYLFMAVITFITNKYFGKPKHRPFI